MGLLKDFYEIWFGDIRFNEFARHKFRVPLTAEVQRRAYVLVGDPGADVGNSWVAEWDISPEDAKLLLLWSSLSWHIEHRLEVRLGQRGWYEVRDVFGHLMEQRLGLGTIRCRIHFHGRKQMSLGRDTLSFLLNEPIEFTVSWSASVLQRLSNATPYVSIVSKTVDVIRKEFSDMGLPWVEEHA